ncbi:MAG: glycosyltransferase family A protein [Simkaniaceae bacterium]|nr:glycosyltransferase family A protein [Simkaniaceae bacterium]
MVGRKALPFAERCIHSILGQQGRHSFDWLYVDDASKYSRIERDQLLLLMEGKVLFLSHRHYQLGAIHQGMKKLQDPYSIVCLVDGDDYLLGDALMYVAKAYENPAIALTYGNVLLDFRPYQDPMFQYFSDKQTVNTKYSASAWSSGAFRQEGFRCFHLRTFRKWLWDLIDPKDFLRPDGTPIRASGDSAFIYPMLELLADPKHVAFIDTPLYVYRLHAGNVHNHDKKSQTEDLDYIRFKLPAYPPMDRLKLRRHLNHRR